jgi:hypothetical protein
MKTDSEEMLITIMYKIERGQIRERITRISVKKITQEKELAISTTNKDKILTALRILLDIILIITNKVDHIKTSNSNITL